MDPSRCCLQQHQQWQTLGTVTGMTPKKTEMTPRHQMGVYQSETLEKTMGGYEKGMKGKRENMLFSTYF